MSKASGMSELTKKDHLVVRHLVQQGHLLFFGNVVLEAGDEDVAASAKTVWQAPMSAMNAFSKGKRVPENNVTGAAVSLQAVKATRTSIEGECVGVFDDEIDKLTKEADAMHKANSEDEFKGDSQQCPEQPLGGHQAASIADRN